MQWLFAPKVLMHVSRVRRSIYLAVWAIAATLMGVVGQAQAAAAAGEIVFASGDATLNGASAVKGMPVLEGAQLQTGQAGTIYLKTIDNGFLVLRQNSKATVVTYQVNSAVPSQSRIKIDLDHGVARHISGDAVKLSRQNFRFNTPVAAIGVRGTDFTVFADAQVMRVNVNSGGIVVGALGVGCIAAGTGPCEGAASRELFAGEQNLLLQVRRGEKLPELLRSVELRPDAVTPPRSDEPSDVKSGQGSRHSTDNRSNSGHDGGVSKSDLASSDLIEVGTLRALTAPPSTQPPVAEPVSRQVVWGRWAPVADAPREAAKLALTGGSDFMPPALVDSYFITRTAQDNFVLPAQGRFAFTMTAGEAFVVDASGLGGAAAIVNPQLEVDFVKREFGTSLQVVRGSTNVDIRAQGDVTTQGELVSDLFRSNAVVRGQLSGTAAQGAAYIFNRQLDNGLRVIGGTSWAR